MENCIARAGRWTVDPNTEAVNFTVPNITVGYQRVFIPNGDYYFPIPQGDIDLGKLLLKQNLNW